jgi:hypothetical protein
MQVPAANLILSRDNSHQLTVALSTSGNASANLFWDDGDLIGMFSSLFVLLLI